ncbi:tubby-like F-box protein 8 [Triticum aestivum]|uniref:tubby-like F-box protein 8 n=1 Tax=Triticum aestivum TaxID=4565 RepID=UPI001D002324|nr:tubby-like F-box protein 8 [Triticum aestivum]XP_044450561.1 tubby-like F-box protein 8 [Triticum aestivum]
MSFRSIVRDVRDGFGSLSRRSFEVTISGLSGLTGHHRGKCQSTVHELRDADLIVQESRWASLPPELLSDVIRRLEASESTWPSRKHVVSCAAVCKAWREMCREIVTSPEFCGKLTFPVSLKQPGPRDGMIQCFIKRDKSKSTYHLYLCLTNAVLVENGKFLLSAKRIRRTTCTEYVISMDAENISRSSSTYIGKLRSNFLGTKFIVYDTQPPYNGALVPPVGRSSRRFNSKKVSPKVPSGSYNIAQVSYELNVLGTRGPRRMNCIMHSIPASSVEPGGVVPGQPEQIVPRALGDSFRSITSFSQSFRSSATFSRSIMDQSMDFNSARFSEISGCGGVTDGDGEGEVKERPLVLRNKPPRWHEQLQCWCLNFRGRVTVASVKNFQLTAAAPQVAAVPPSEPSQPPQQQQLQPSSSSSSSTSDHEKVILQFGKVTKDMFTMDYRYPLSAFQAFAICLTSFDTKLACE